MKFLSSLIFVSITLSLCCVQPPSNDKQTRNGYTTVQDTNTLTILTPSLATRKIAKIRLENGLEAYLVSDPAAESSAAALAIHVGSWSDPEEFPGMAHFLEHMLFMGTAAYPDEQAFSQYINDHGGTTNAYTALDRTVYMFSINNDAFTKGLDLFSHFFIDPLFKTSEVGRELHAVDQEHSKNIQNDSRRKWMIFKETGNQSHPNRAFATGNATTLGHIPREALIAWYQQYYKASLMHLVLYSPLPIDTLTELTVRDFSAVPDKKGIALPAYAPLSSPEQKGAITYITPVQDLKILSLEWELPKMSLADQETHSTQLIAHVLEQGGEHSLIEELKREKLAESLSASFAEYSTEHGFFHINIMLTKEGVSQVNTVLERCFQTLALLKTVGIPSYLFDEMQTMTTLNYEYQSRSQPFDFVSAAADGLIDEPLATYPQHTLLASQYSPQNVRFLLDLLTPKNCMISLIASPSLTGVLPDRKEKWNGGEYSVHPISDLELKKLSVLAPYPGIEIPPPNPYIPTELHLVHDETLNPSSSEIPTPTLVTQDEYGKNYAWEDIRYKTPEVFYILGFKTPSVDGLAKSVSATDLLIKTFYQKSAPTLSRASTAGLTVVLEQNNFKLSLKLYGYSQKAPELLQYLLLNLKNLICTKEEFQIYKDSLVALYENQQKAQPYIQAGALLANALYNDSPLSIQKVTALKALSYEEFALFLSDFLSQCYIEGLYTGNLTREEASMLAHKTISILSPRPYPLAEQHAREVLLLPADTGPYAITEQIEVLGNAALLVIEQGPFSFEKKASQLLLSTLLSESFYNTLRAQQQTGYITASWHRDVQQQLLQFFLVQSSTHEPQDLLTRFELFLEGYMKDFSAQLSKERFDEIKNSCIVTLLQIPPNLAEMTDDLYELAFERKGNFQFIPELVTALSTLSYETLKQDAFLFFSRKNTRRLAVLAAGEIAENFCYKTTTVEALKATTPLTQAVQDD
jgi:insulysin